MPGVKGKRVAGRPGRFDPTIPLHMTTRRKAAKTAPDMDMYGDDEYDDADSRRTSLDEISVTTPYSDFDSEPPAKRQRTADASPQQSTASPLEPENKQVLDIDKVSSGLFNVREGMANGSVTSSGNIFAPSIDLNVSQDSVDHQTADDNNYGENHAEPSDVQMTEGGSERHDYGPGPDKTQPNDTQQQYENSNGTEIKNEETGVESRYNPEEMRTQVDIAHQSGDESNWAEAVDPLPSTRESEVRDASVESSRSDVPAVRDLPLPEGSTDATPMVTRQGSPATTASAAAEELTPARTKAADTLGLTGSEEDDEEEEEEGDDAEPATEIQDTMENLEDEEVEVPRSAEEYEEDDAPVRKTTKRRFAGGRRRAAHANAYVEAALRRQLELKQIYRQVTRSMKACLGELAQITLDELETDQQNHAQASEYDLVIAELDEQLARRKQQLLNAQKFNHEQLLQRYDAESASRKNRCRNLLEDIKEQQLVNLEYNMLQVNRAKLRDEAKPGHETEDEDGVIPRPKRMAYRFKRSNAIDLRYDSRSRFTMETERRVDDLQRRTNMWEALSAFDPEAIEAFTVMDSAAREAAEERRRNVDITSKLADIAAEYDRLHNAPAPLQPPLPPTAEELAPLNALAELAAAPGRSQRPKGRHLPSSSIGPFQHISNPSRSPFPQPAPFDRSTGNTPTHPHTQTFLRMAMEQSRAPPHAFGQSPISSLLSPTLRPSEDVSNKASTAARHGMEGRPPLAAKPAPQHDQTNHERPQATHPRPQPSTDRLLDEIMSGPPRQTLHVDRAMLLARETARRIMEEPDATNQHSVPPTNNNTSYHQDRTGSAGHTDAVS